MKIEIKNIFNKIIYNIEANNIKEAIETKIKGKHSLIGADLIGANLISANLTGANLRGANLRGADLISADLTGANLISANLTGANLISANLTGANLRGANLRGADLISADLTGANLISANLRDTKGINKFSTSQLYILLEQPDPIRAYKLVNDNYESPISYITIKYEIGKEYKEKADNDEYKQCSYGINLATLNWCFNWYTKGYKILIAEFNKKDIAAIPLGSDGKFRVSRCKIIGEKNLKEIGLE